MDSYVDDQQTFERENKNRKQKEISRYQIYWLQVEHTGDYLLNDLKMLFRNGYDDDDDDDDDCGILGKR